MNEESVHKVEEEFDAVGKIFNAYDKGYPFSPEIQAFLDYVEKSGEGGNADHRIRDGHILRGKFENGTLARGDITRLTRLIVSWPKGGQNFEKAA